MSVDAEDPIEHEKKERTRTQAWSEQHNVQVCHKLLLVGVEQALPSYDVPRQADADNFQDGLKDEEDQVWKGRV